MTRKDTILIAVLINAGLLIVMFATTIKPSTTSHMSKKSELVQKPEEKKESLATKNEIDRMVTSLSKPKEEPKPPPKKAVEKVVQTAPEKKLPEVKYASVTVKAGDVLEKIAKAHHVTVKEIMEMNHLQNSKLQIGQMLYVPAASSKPKVDEVKFYEVKNGDNPWTIASKNRIKVEELLKLNGLDEEKARRIKPGDRLRIQ